MSKLRLLLCASLIGLFVIPVVRGQGAPSGPSRSFISQIAPDFAIVTEVSLDTPYVGQQFCIIYKLRAQHPPAAVDIDPQQYSGFWTELIPISQDAAASPRILKERGAVDYLLRQIVAYPLLEGRQKLPPLSLKIKRAGNITDRREDWDLLGASAPVDIAVSPLPPTSQAGAGMLLVGNVNGLMSPAGEDGQAILLEIQGTANLALFKPLDWLQPPAGVQVHQQLVGAEKQPQTVDIEGRRQLSLLQRQRWLLGIDGAGPGRRLGAFYLPVFEPREKLWKVCESPARRFRAPSLPRRNLVRQRNASRLDRVRRHYRFHRAPCMWFWAWPDLPFC